MKEVIHHTAYMNWGELRAFPGPADGKILREDAETGAKTLLVRLPPGAHVIAHGAIEGLCSTTSWRGNMKRKGSCSVRGAIA